MLHFCTANKRTMEAARKDNVYVTVMIDLVNAGVVPKEAAEKLLGYTLPDHVLDKVPVITSTGTGTRSVKKDADDEE